MFLVDIVSRSHNHDVIMYCASGQILVDGAPGTGAQSGGGSGGGVYIRADDITGHGLLSSSGGAGTGNAGGGAGGRIRLELDSE